MSDVPAGDIGGYQATSYANTAGATTLPTVQYQDDSRQPPVALISPALQESPTEAIAPGHATTEAIAPEHATEYQSCVSAPRLKSPGLPAQLPRRDMQGLSSLSLLNDINWDNCRERKPYRGGAGETVWYHTSGSFSVHSAPDSLSANPGDLYVHCDSRDHITRSWVSTSDEGWITVRVGDIHPLDKTRRLIFQTSGDPSWVTIKTYRQYCSRHKKNRRLDVST